MKIKDSKQIRKQLEEEYNENCSKIYDLNKKIEILKENNFETKVSGVLLFSVISWTGSIILTPIIIKYGIIPLNIVQPLSVGIPTLIGIAAEELFAKKLKSRAKLTRFSKSKTQKEQIEESTKYEIEKEKLKNKNKVLKKSYDNLLENENLITSLSTSYNITEKDVDERTKEEINNNIENLNNILQQKQQEMDLATTKNVLREKFWRVRDKFYRFYDILTLGMIGGLVSMLLYDMPIIYQNQLGNIQFQTNFLGLLAPAIIGGLACGSYGVKKRNNFISVFKTINNELNDNAISEFSDYEKEKYFKKDLENIIKDTCEIKLQLKTEKQKLENAVLNCNKEETIDKKQTLDANFINEQLESYQKLLESQAMQEMKDSTVEGPKLLKKLPSKNN